MHYDKTKTFGTDLFVVMELPFLMNCLRIFGRKRTICLR